MVKYRTTYIAHSKVTTPSSDGKKHIAIIGGGMSAEREISLVSSEAVIKVLIDSGYKVTFIDMGADVGSVVAQIAPDIIFNCLHGTYGEDGCIQGLLNILNIPYTHSGLSASVIAFNKLHSKALFIAHNIKSAKFIILNKSDNIRDDPMKRPYVIKPIAQGSSIGVEVIFAEDDFSFANYDFPYGDQILIEEYITGREMQVAVLNGKALGVLEIKLLKNRFNDYETKYVKGFAKHLFPAPIEKDIYDHLLLESEKIYKIMSCNSIARTEFIYNEQENACYLLELNTHPGFTPLSIFPEIAALSGIGFSDLIEDMLKTVKCGM